jgi:hypothetical protein
MVFPLKSKFTRKRLDQVFKFFESRVGRQSAKKKGGKKKVKKRKNPPKKNSGKKKAGKKILPHRSPTFRW